MFIRAIRYIISSMGQKKPSRVHDLALFLYFHVNERTKLMRDIPEIKKDFIKTIKCFEERTPQNTIRAGR